MKQNKSCTGSNQNILVLPKKVNQGIRQRLRCYLQRLFSLAITPKELRTTPEVLRQKTFRSTLKERDQYVEDLARYHLVSRSDSDMVPGLVHLRQVTNSKVEISIRCILEM